MSTTRPPAYDERSSGQAEASRRGAHRARAKPVMAGLPVVAGVLIVLAAAGGAWTVLGSGANDSSSIVGAVPGDSEPTPAATVPKAAPSAVPSAQTQPNQAAATTAAAPTTAPAATKAPAATVDRSVSLVILNSVAVQGLAKRVASNLQPDGWTVSRTDNSIQKNLATTKVYYGSKARRATAQALVKDLGFGVIVPDASVAKAGLVVVLGQDAV
jgi:LytR cell envelope-related transcriptional attenuator